MAAGLSNLPLVGRSGVALATPGWGEEFLTRKLFDLVIPAEAGIQTHKRSAGRFWIPAFAGMTDHIIVPNTNGPETVGFGKPPTRRAKARRPPHQGEVGK